MEVELDWEGKETEASLIPYHILAEDIFEAHFDTSFIIPDENNEAQ